MANWCWICRCKVDSTYVYYMGEKCHPSCKAKRKKQEQPYLSVPIKPQPSSDAITGQFTLTDPETHKSLQAHLQSGKRIELHADMDEETGEIASIYFLAFVAKTEIEKEVITTMKSLSHKLNKYIADL